MKVLCKFITQYSLFAQQILYVKVEWAMLDDEETAYAMDNLGYIRPVSFFVVAVEQFKDLQP